MAKKFKLLVLIPVILIVVGNLTYAQENSNTWFNAGIKAQSPEEKISNYLKAIALDPKFIQAYYNLGYVYKEVGDYVKAEQAFRMALTCDQQNLTKDNKLRISYELGLTLRKLNRLRAAVEALEGARQLTQEADVLAAILYELGRTKVMMEKYAEAIFYFEQGAQLNSDKQASFLSASRNANRLNMCNQYYEQAVDLIAQNRLDEAEQTLLKVVNIESNFKDALTKLSEVRNLNNEQQQNNKLIDDYNRAVRYMNSNDWTNAISTLEKIYKVNPDFKDVKAQLVNARSNLNQEIQVTEYENILQQGIADYNRGNWGRALASFEIVRNWNAEYKNVSQWYQNTQSKMRNEQNDSIKQQYYDQGKFYLKNKKWEMAISVFNKLIALDNNYRDVQLLQNEALVGLDETSKLNHFNRFYSEGLALFAKKEWLQASVAFEKAKQMNPENADVLQKLMEIEEKLKEQTPVTIAEINPGEQQNTSTQNTSTMTNFLWLFAIIPFITLLSVVLVYIKSRPLKAKRYMNRGDYTNAATIYESILLTKPHKTKLYPLLATIYLKQDRDDPPARKIYERALQTNPEQELREQIINKITHEKPVSISIEDKNMEILEELLQQELDKLKRNVT